MARNGKKQIAFWVSEDLKRRYEMLLALHGLNGSEDMSSYVKLLVESHLEVIEKLEKLEKEVDLEKAKLQTFKRYGS